MRVLVAAIRYPPAPGGAEVYAHEIAKELMRRGHEVEVWTSDLMREHPFERLKEPFGTVDGVRVHRCRAWTPGEMIHYPVMPGELGMLRAGADVVHSNSFGYFHTNVAAARRRLRGTPLVISTHYHPPETMQGGPARHLLRRVYDGAVAGWVFDQADRIVAVSRAELGSMRHHIRDMGKARVIPSGIDPARFAGSAPDGREFLERGGIGGPVLLYVGRLAQNKHMELVIGLMPELLEQVPDLTLVIAGPDDGAGAAWKRQAADLGLGDRVRFEGYLAERDLLGAYAAADALVLPSDWEAFGLVLLEAMACRTPCVVADRGGAPEVVEDGRTGIVARYGDPAAWREAILRLLGDDRLRREMGERGREVALTRYSWSAVTDGVEALFKELVDGGGTTAGGKGGVRGA